MRFRPALTIAVILASHFAQAYESTHLRELSIKECIGALCFKATAALGFVSMSGAQISAGDAKLEITHGAKIERHNCASLNYSFSSQQFFCDNSTVGGQSLSISPNANREAQIRIFN